MNAPALIAPQYGRWSSMPPRTDNPASADRPARCPDLIRLQLLKFRNEANERAELQRMAGGGLWI